MTTRSKLETLKILLVQWQRSHGLAEAAAVCEFLSDNLDTRDIDPEPAKDYLMDALNDDALMERVMKKSAEMQAETIKKAEGEE